MNKGIYCLVIYVSKNKKIQIGKLGNSDFKKGYYVYVGSALNNLEKRISRHQSKNKKIYWHIDYLTAQEEILEIKKFITDKKLECSLAAKVNKLSDGNVSSFGCGDCNCKTHLFYFRKNPLEKIKKIKF